MPVNKKYPLEKLKSTILDNYGGRSRKMTFEYVLLKNINDSNEEILEFVKFVGDLPIKVNLIPYNSISGEFKSPDKKRIMEILDLLLLECLTSTIGSGRFRLDIPNIQKFSTRHLNTSCWAMTVKKTRFTFETTGAWSWSGDGRSWPAVGCRRLHVSELERCGQRPGRHPGRYRQRRAVR